MSLLQSTNDLWTKQIDASAKSKYVHFGRVANELWKYLGEPYNKLYIEQGLHDGSGTSSDRAFPDGEYPYHTARINKSFEFIALMIPYVFASVPHRLATSRVPALPADLMAMLSQMGPETVQRHAMEKAAASLLTWWLNYLPGQTGLAAESRAALPEAFCKGRGVLWHELVSTPNGVIPGSFYESVDGLFLDSDSERVADCSFIIRKRRMAAWKLSEIYKIPVDQIRGAGRSSLRLSADAVIAESHQSDNERDDSSYRDDSSDKPNTAGDVVVFYEIYSRMGLGWQLPDAPQSATERGDEEITANLIEALAETGPFVRLVIIPGMSHPLNLPRHIMTGTGAVSAIVEALKWPIPFHVDQFSPWPCSMLDFYRESSNPWAISPLRAALPLQRFIDHVITYIMNRARHASRILIPVAADLQDAVKEAMESGADFSMIETDRDPEEIKKQMGFITFPDVSKDLYQALDISIGIFEQITGMNSLLSANPQHQMRSASEAQVLNAFATNRPDDYAQQVESWQSEVARKEAMMSRMYVNPAMVQKLFREEGPQGGPLTQLWNMLIATPDSIKASSEWAYELEAGSARRKNKQKQVADANQLIQTYLPAAMQYGFTQGDFGPANQLTAIFGEALDLPLERLFFPNVQPPPPEGQKPPNAKTK